MLIRRKTFPTARSFHRAHEVACANAFLSDLAFLPPPRLRSLPPSVRIARAGFASMRIRSRRLYSQSEQVTPTLEL